MGVSLSCVQQCIDEMSPTAATFQHTCPINTSTLLLVRTSYILHRLEKLYKEIDQPYRSALGIFLKKGHFLMSIKITFIIGQLSDDEFEQLKNGYSILSKMILPPDDFKLFRYKEGDKIQVETKDGLRLWCNIDHLEILEHEERVILIFTLSSVAS